MTSETVLRQYPDGHRLSRDSRQWIVQHPHTCPNARRGPKGNFAYAKYTYLTQEANARMEVSACHLEWPAA